MMSIVFLVCLLVSGASALRDVTPMDCKIAMTKAQCFADAACYWCESNMPFSGQESICVDHMQASLMPSFAYKCKHHKAPSVEETVVSVAPASDCRDVKTQDDCQTNQCFWCTSKVSPGKGYCTDATGASYVPAAWWDCAATPAAADDVSTEEDTLQKGGAGPVDPVGPTPGASCQMTMDRKTCLSNPECYWCQNQFSPAMNARCTDKTQAQFLPAYMYKCKKGKAPKPAPAPQPGPDADGEVVVNAVEKKDDPTPAPAPAPACSDAKDKKSCQDVDGCAWCENQYVPSGAADSCMDADQAKFIPETVMKCKAGKKGKKGGEVMEKKDDPTPAPAPAPAPMCSDAKDKKSCRDIDNCAWCENQYVPSGAADSCMDADQAKFIPAMVMKCKAAKKGKKGGAALEKKADPTPAPAPMCSDAKDKKSCQDIDSCAWCENQYVPSGASDSCMDADQAKFIPATVMKCKAGKKGKKGGAADVVEAAVVLSADAPVDPEPLPACKGNKDKDSCLDQAGCAWCQHQFVPAGLGDKCMNASKAASIPAAIMKCKASAKSDEGDNGQDVMVNAVEKKDDPTPAPTPAPAPAPAPMCSDAKDKKSCRDIDNCAWCENQYVPSGAADSCMDADQAKFIPVMVMKCKAAKKGKKGGAALEKKDDPTPTPAPMCSDAKDKKSCQDVDSCAWCENQYVPSGAADSCMDADQAKFIPATVMKCKAGKKGKKGGAALEKKADPTPAPGPMCSDAKDKKSCQDIDSCAWCENQYVPSGTSDSCMDAEQAKFIPETVMKCKAGKKGKKGGAAPAVAAAAPECSLSMNKDKCLGSDGCYWCKSSLGQLLSVCLDQAQAKLMPTAMYKCSTADKTPTTGLLGTLHTLFFGSHSSGSGSSDSGSAFSASGSSNSGSGSSGSGTSGSGSSGSGGAAPPSPGASCTSAMDKAACGASKGCYWCENRFTPGMGARCMDEMSAKFLPDMVFKCKKAKPAKPPAAVVV